MGSSSEKRRQRQQLKLAHRAHPLSHIIRSITSKTKQRLLREHNRHHHGVRGGHPRSRIENLLLSGFTFSGSGAKFQQYGKLNHRASGWNEERIDRLLEPRISNEEKNLPNGPEPRLDSDYIDTHLLCLPEDLRRNIRKQGVIKRQRRIESYFVNTYGYIPPRVRRLISGSYRPSEKGLPALRRSAKSDARRRYIQHLSATSSASASFASPSASPSSTISTPPRRQHPRRVATATARRIPSDTSPSSSHMSPLGFDLSPISPSIHDIIQQVQDTQPLPQQQQQQQQQGPSFQVVNRRYERLQRSPSLEITGDQPARTPPPPTPPTPPGEKEYEEYESPRSTSSNFMGFSPLRGDDTPPPPAATPGEVAMNLVEESAKDLETVLNVAETGVKSLLSRIRDGEKVVAARTPPPPPPPLPSAANDNDDDDDGSDAALHDILQEEFNHPPINTSIGDQRQYTMENMENMYDDLLDHNNTPITPRPRTPPREQQPLLPPPQAPVPRKPMARIAYKPPMPLPPLAHIAHKAPMAPPPPPLPISRKRLAPPYPILSPPSMFRDRRLAPSYPILSPPSMFRDRRRTFGTQVGNDRGVHNTLNEIFHDFCTGKKNTRQAIHKILDIVHQISKENIR